MHNYSSRVPKINFAKVKLWLEHEAPQCSIGEMEELKELINRALGAAENADHKRSEALRQMNEIAKQAGFTDVTDVLKAPEIRAKKAAAASGARRPFMNPFDPESDCYSLSNRPDKRPHWPKWVDELFARGWTKEDLHYKKHARGMRIIEKREPLYNANERYRQLNSTDF